MATAVFNALPVFWSFGDGANWQGTFKMKTFYNSTHGSLIWFSIVWEYIGFWKRLLISKYTKMPKFVIVIIIPDRGLVVWTHMSFIQLNSCLYILHISMRVIHWEKVMSVSAQYIDYRWTVESLGWLQNRIQVGTYHKPGLWTEYLGTV